MLSTENLLIRSDKANNTLESYCSVLMDGVFDAKDALDLITAMYQQKLRFHESKIQLADSEEDIKQREEKIKQLQAHLSRIRALILGGEKAQVHTEITVQML